jgi:hypothetical protein
MWLEGGTLHGAIGDATARGLVLVSAFSPVPSRLYHVAYTFDNQAKQQTLYVNGSPVASGTSPKTIGYDTQSLFIGSGPGSGFLQGRIDEAAVYSRALNAAEIDAIFHAGPAGKRLA